MKKFFVAPSILSADFANLGQDIEKSVLAGGDIIHFDVMDNCYVPNLTIGPVVLQSLKKYQISVPIDVHLMVQSVDNIIPLFAKEGVDFITFHPESTHNVYNTIHLIKSYGCKVGVALNPDTPIKILDNIFNELDLIVLMGVYPGFSGQSFIPYVLDKIKKLRNIINNFFPNILLELDGGIALHNIYEIAVLGIDIFVIGSAIFNSSSYRKTIQNIHYQLKDIEHNKNFNIID